MKQFSPSLQMWLTADLRHILRGLAASTAGMIDNDFRKGYLAALVAVATAVGAIDDDELRTGVAFLLPPGGRQ